MSHVLKLRSSIAKNPGYATKETTGRDGTLGKIAGYGTGRDPEKFFARDAGRDGIVCHERGTGRNRKILVQPISVRYLIYWNSIKLSFLLIQLHVVRLYANY